MHSIEFPLRNNPHTCALFIFKPRSNAGVTHCLVPAKYQTWRK
jgi:hypothetical protein